MTITYCDITGNEVSNATTNYAWRIRDRRYDMIKGRDFSVEGLAKLEAAVREELGQNERYNYMEYKAVLARKIAKMTE
jgi:hypothetical protein